MIGREVLLKQEELIHVIEDPVEERAQKVRLAVDVLHLFESLIVNPLLALRTDLSH